MSERVRILTRFKRSVQGYITLIEGSGWKTSTNPSTLNPFNVGIESEINDLSEGLGWGIIFSRREVANWIQLGCIDAYKQQTYVSAGTSSWLGCQISDCGVVQQVLMTWLIKVDAELAEPADNPGALENQDDYTIAAVTEMIGVSDQTLNTYAKKAGISTPTRGKRNHRYSAAQVHLILRTIKASSSNRGMVSRAVKALGEIEVKSKTNPN